MKISEMNTMQLSACLAELAAPVANIMEDAEVGEAMKKLALRDHTKLVAPVQQWGATIRALVPVAFRSHAADVCAIVAALTGKSIDQIQKQKGLQTIKDAINSFDAELLDFFSSSDTTAAKQ